jgi:ATP-dependent helicase HrpB
VANAPLTQLPIDDALPEIVEALRRSSCLVIEAPPGAGKTTRVPTAILDAGIVGTQSILVLEPRRMAARLSAKRVAQERGERVGETIGYQVRFDDQTGPKTRIFYLTEGLFARRLLDDPGLRGVGAVILDEFHERHLQTDLALASTLRLIRSNARPDLKLIAMSATLDAGPLAEHLRCPVVRSEGRRFPVEIESIAQPDERRLEDQIAAAVRKLTVPGTSGDLLVFLPGAGEIRRAETACRELAEHRSLVLLPLHGDLSPEEQDRAIARGNQRKVILATNVAETSVTIDGVTRVVDSGLARIAGHSVWTGLPTLKVGKISQSSAQQRAGRAGRTAPGICLRLYTAHDYATRPAHHPPEVERLDLAELVLSLRAQGLDPRALPWLDAPDEHAMQAAEELLARLGFVSKLGAVSALGRAAVKLPLHPRLARLLLEAQARGAGDEGCSLAAILSDRDLRSREGRENAGPTGPSDLTELAELLKAARNSRFDPGRTRGLGLDVNAARRVDQARAQLARSLPREAPNSPRLTDPRLLEASLGLAALAAFPDRVAKRRAPNSSELILSGGGSAQLARESVVREAQLLVAVDVEERNEARNFGNPNAQRGALVRMASAIEAEWLLDLFADDLTESVEFTWAESRERVEVLSRMRYGALILEESRRLPKMDDEREATEASKLLFTQARAKGLANNANVDALTSLQIRAGLIARYCPEAGLRALESSDVDAALEDLCQGNFSLEELGRLDLLGAIARRAGPNAESLLSRLTPDQVSLPQRRISVHYTRDAPPFVESRLQDFFGQSQGPSICNGRLLLVCHLLAPNGRAQQVTQDLVGFWERHYPAIRRELMRNYPRHPWPEDGATAAPPPPKPPRPRRK